MKGGWRVKWRYLQIAAIAISVVIFAVMFKYLGSAYSIYIVIGGCILIFYFSVNRLFVVFSAIEEIQSYIKISSTYLNTLIKIIGITYIAEFTSSICKDAGYAAIASQIEMFGKLSILAVSMPVILALLKTVQNILDFA